MIEKYRVHEVAKDLGVQSKEVIDLLAENFEGERKSMTALDEKELSVVLNHYTNQHQVASFDAFFAQGEAKKRAAKGEAKAKAEQIRVEQQAALQKQVKPVTEAPVAAATQAPAAPVTPSAPQAPVAAAPTAAPQAPAAPSAPSAQAGKPQVFQSRPALIPNQNRPVGQPGGVQPRVPQQPQQQGTFQPRPQGQQGTGTFQPRPQGQQGTGTFQPRPQGQQGGYQQRPQGGQQGGYQQRPPYNNNNGGNSNQPGGYQGRPPFNGGAPGNPPRPQPAPQPVVPGKPRPRPSIGGSTVDTRAGSTQVDMDKYNEKYDNLAQSKLGNAPVVVAKQKLTQRSAQRRAGKPVMSRKEKEDAKMRKLEMERQRRKNLEVTLPEEIMVGDLAARLHVTSAEIIKRLIPLGVMATVNEMLDYDTASMVAIEIGAKVEREVVLTIEDRLFEVEDDGDENMVERSPVVVVMGHVDHGKTSLLDAIRHAKVTEGEAGGITQHIGAYQVPVNGKFVTFLDTPGHAAFTSMRARGAQITDIAVLVVAADDGIMPQTVEAINHAKAAGVSIIIAINKMDKPSANPDKIMQSLTEYELVPEAWGGDVPCMQVSAKTGAGIPELLEMIQLIAETSELKANPDKMAKGTVIEAKLDKGRGPIATILVQSGTLRTGDAVIAGTTFGRVRVMTNDMGERVEEAGPSMPVEITGLGDVPAAGDVFNSVEDERLAKELVGQRKFENKEEIFSAYEKVTLDNLFSHISDGDIKELPIIVKADVQGSVEAVKQSLEKLSNEEVRVKVIHGAVGAVSESDVMLADASGAIIVGFNVRPEPAAKENADRDGVELRLYRIIYDAINDVETAMKGMLAPKFRDIELGRAEVRNVFKITNYGIVAGCYVLEGKITRSAEIRVVRDGIIVADVKLDSLKRFKDDVKEVAKGYECGMGLTKFSNLKEGDIFEAYEVEEYRE